jgi:hypothetical protein
MTNKQHGRRITEPAMEPGKKYRRRQQSAQQGQDVRQGQDAQQGQKKRKANPLANKSEGLPDPNKEPVTPAELSDEDPERKIQIDDNPDETIRKIPRLNN